MSLAPNQLVPVPNGFMVCYEDRSWLSVGQNGNTYWDNHKDNALVIRSKFVAVLVAKFWDAKRARSDAANRRSTS